MQPTFLYYWRLPDGTLHTTTDPIEADTALHSPYHPCIMGTRLPPAPAPPDDDDDDTPDIPDHPSRPLDPFEPDEETPEL